MKAVLRGKFISWSAFNKRSKTQQINDLTLQLKALEKEEQNSTKSSRRQEIVKLRAEINEIETFSFKNKKKQKKSFRITF